MHIFDLGPGTTASMVAGSATESAVIGTASDAISRLPLDQDTLKTLQANVATAYSLTYIFGLITIVVFTSQVAPLLLRKDLKKEATVLWENLGGNTPVDELANSEAVMGMIGRVYAVTVGAGKTVEQMNGLIGAGAHIEKVSRRGFVPNLLPISPCNRTISSWFWGTGRTSSGLRRRSGTSA